MRINFTVGTKSRPARPGERSMDNGNILIRQSLPSHIRPRSIDIFVVEPVAEVILEVPVQKGCDRSDVEVYLLDMDVATATSSTGNLDTRNIAYKEAARILTEVHGFQWHITPIMCKKFTYSLATHLNVYSDGEWQKFRWGRRPPSDLFLYFHDGSWLSFVLKHGDWRELKIAGICFLPPALFIMIPMLWWSRRFTSMQLWAVIIVWVLLCGAFDIITWKEEQYHPVWNIYIIRSAEDSRPFVGNEGLMICHGSDRPPPYLEEESRIIMEEIGH